MSGVIRSIFGKVTAEPFRARWRFILLALGITLYQSVGTLSACASTLVNKTAPEFVRTDLDHRKLDLNAYRGKVVLLNFWASWCAPCQVEMPRFIKWQNQYASRGFQIVGISMDDDPALAREAFIRLKLNYPVAMGDATLGERYGGILGLPATFLIDRHGVVRGEYRGESKLDTIEKQLQSLLSGR